MPQCRDPKRLKSPCIKSRSETPDIATHELLLLFHFPYTYSFTGAESLIQLTPCPVPETGYIELERWSGLREKEQIFDGKVYFSYFYNILSQPSNCHTRRNQKKLLTLL